MPLKKKIRKLHKNEEWLINKWRNEYRYSELTVVIQDGIPQRIKIGISQQKPDTKEIIKDTPYE
jgi:hypothetical protein